MTLGRGAKLTRRWEVVKERCPHAPWCEFSENTSRVDEADALLFHGFTLKSKVAPVFPQQLGKGRLSLVGSPSEKALGHPLCAVRARGGAADAQPRQGTPALLQLDPHHTLRLRSLPRLPPQPAGREGRRVVEMSGRATGDSAPSNWAPRSRPHSGPTSLPWYAARSGVGQAQNLPQPLQGPNPGAQGSAGW